MDRAERLDGCMEDSDTGLGCSGTGWPLDSPWVYQGPTNLTQLQVFCLPRPWTF